MTTSWALSRSLERIGQLCRDVPDDRELRRGVLAELGRMVPFSAFAWPLADPGSATGTSPMARIPCPAAPTVEQSPPAVGRQVTGNGRTEWYVHPAD